MRQDTLFRLLLRVYPREFRDRNGEEMVRLFRERRGDALARGGRAGLLRFWAGTLGDAASTAGREWWDRLAGTGSRERSGTTGSTGTTGTTGTTATTGGGGMDGWMADLRYSMRTLLGRPGFTAVTVITVALGIGANTAIFSVVRSVLLRPLPYDEPDRIVLLWGEMRNRGVNHFPASPADFQDYRTMSSSFESLGGVFVFPQALTGDGDPEQVEVATVTEGFLETLRVRPALGRGFAPPDFDAADPDADPGAPAVNDAVLLTHHIWRQRWGGDPSVVGRIIDLGGTPAEVVGVLPADFAFMVPPSYALPDRPAIWRAGRFGFDVASRNNVFLRLVGRLAPGVSVEQAGAEMDRIAADLRERWPIRASSDHHLHVRPLQAELTSHVRPVIVALAGAVALVLLIACANVSNLLLVRAAGRRQEMAVRAALGGTRWRLVRQTLLEGLLLAAVGGILGVVLALGGIDLLLALEPGDVPRLEEVRVDLPVLAFAGGAVLLSALLVGFLPALQTSRPDVAGALGERGRTGGGTSGRARRGIVVMEVALSLLLLIGAGLLVRSFVALQRIDPGFEAGGVVTFAVNLPFGRYPQPADRYGAQARLHEQFAAIPGVESVTLGLPLPLDGTLANVRWGKEEALENPERYQQADVHFIGPRYFETLGTRLLAGRTFTQAEHADAADAVILDEIMARRAFPEGDPVGKRILIRATGPEAEWREVIGVVEHQRHRDLTEETGGAVFFTHHFGGAFGGTWAVRTELAPGALVPAIRGVVEAFDPLSPVADVVPLQASLDRARAPTRFALVLMGVFAALAAVLAAVGLYGVLAYLVRERTGEIGVRMAFGAPRGRILRLVVGQGMRLSVAGAALGLAGALLLARVMEGMVVGIEPRDPATFGAVTALFLAVAATATAIPAWRASRVDPSEALRRE